MLGFKNNHRRGGINKKIDFKRKEQSEESSSVQPDSQIAETLSEEDNHNTGLDSDQPKKIEKETALVEKNKEVDIKKYKDPEGLTVPKMEFGLWLVEHRKQLLLIPVVLLILVSVATWAYTIYGFSHYIFWGMKEDQVLVNELVKQNLVGHDFFVARSAQELGYHEVQIIKLEDKKYDFLVQVTNPNERHRAEFEYYFKVLDKEFGRAYGFILPAETKYFTALSQEFEQQPSGVKFYINNLSRPRIDLHQYPDWAKFKREHLDIIVSDIKFTPAKATIITEKLNLNDLQFTTINNTAYNYREVSFIILLFRQNKIIGVNNYILDTFMSGQTQDIKVTWLGRLGRVDNVIITPEINITRDDIYINFEGGIGEEK